MKFAPLQKLAVLTAMAVLANGSLYGADDDESTPLGENMDKVSSSLKSLRKAEGWEAKAEIARKAQEACLGGLKYLPKTFEKITDAKEKAKATADYKRLIGSAYAALCQLESAFLEEDEDAVDEAMSLIKSLKKEGHKKYEDDE